VCWGSSRVLPCIWEVGFATLPTNEVCGETEYMDFVAAAVWDEPRELSCGCTTELLDGFAANTAGVELCYLDNYCEYIAPDPSYYVTSIEEYVPYCDTLYSSGATVDTVNSMALCTLVATFALLH
jgi:hypothetical protein